MAGITRSIVILDLGLFFVDLTTILIILCEAVTGCVNFGPAHPPVGPDPAAGSAAPIPCDTLGFPSPFPICPLLPNFYFHSFSGLSVTQGLNLVSTSVKVPHLGAFIWLQYLNFPPHVPLIKLPKLPAFIRFQYLCFHPSLFARIAFISLQYPKFPAVSLSNFLHSFGFICRLPRIGLSTTSCVYVVSISKFPLHPCASQ